MSRDESDEFGPDPNIGKECPVCDQEYHGVCLLRSSDCPFAYKDEDVEDLDLDDEEEESILLPDLGLDDDFDDEEEDEPDLPADLEDDD